MHECIHKRHLHINIITYTRKYELGSLLTRKENTNCAMSQAKFNPTVERSYQPSSATIGKVYFCSHLSDKKKFVLEKHFFFNYASPMKI